MAMTWKDRLSKGNIPIGTFLVKRVAVIYPIYLLGEFLAIAYKLLHEGWGAITVKHLLTDALFITTGWIDGGVKGPYDGPTWFMCVLVCCYCLYYIICRITSKSRDAYLIAITMMVLLGSYLEHSGLEIPFLYRTSGEGYMNFFFGTLLHAVYDAAHKRAKLKIVKICIGGGIVLVLTGSALLGTDAFWGDKVTVISIICAAVIYLSANVVWLRRLLEVRPAVVMGTISMEIFIMHMPWLFWYQNIIKHSGMVLCSDRVQYIMYLLSLVLLCFLIHFIYQKVRTSGNKG